MTRMGKMISKLTKISFRSRLLIAIILCILLPWIGTFIVSNYFTKDVLEERAVKQSKNTLSMIEMSMSRTLDDIMYTSNYIQFDTNFNSLLKSSQSIDLNSLQSANGKGIQSYLETSKALSDISDIFSATYITILFENDLYYTNYPSYEHDPLTFRDEQWFAELKDLNFYEINWIGAHQTYIQSETESNQYVISMARTMKGLDQSNIYVVISIEEQAIRELFGNFQSPTGSALFLTDQQGTIFSSLNTKDIMSQLPYDITSTEHQIVDYNGQDHLLASYPVSYTNWRLVSLVPYKETIGMINTATRTTIIIQGTFLLLFLFGLIILIREMTKPLTKLNAVTKSVEKGKLNVRAHVSGNNDVAKLGHSFDKMLDTIEEMIDQIKRQEEDKRTAELDMLQAQINPHFLFNVLNSIRLKMRINGDQESAGLIHSLSALLRMTINRNNAFISLDEEIIIVKHYLALMNFRHQEDIKLDVLISNQINRMKVPRFFLQPIVENAFIHGYNKSKGTIIISATITEDNILKLRVSDDGIGMDKAALFTLRHKTLDKGNQEKNKHTHSFNGIGVQNVAQRMKMIYGSDFKLAIESIVGAGTTFTFYIPIQKE